MSFAELPPLHTDSFYSMLSVEPDANDQDLRTAYRRMALMYHPDRHTEEDQPLAQVAFQMISEAYRVLSVPETRAEYDRALARGEAWQESGPMPVQVTLTELLEGFEEFENMHEDNIFKGKMLDLYSIVSTNLLTDLDEHILEIWPLSKAPKEASIRGSMHCGAAVLTNIRLLLPYIYKWTEVNGNTRTTYTQGSLLVGVFHYARAMEITEEGGIQGTTHVRLLLDDRELNFTIRATNLMKLLIAARKWGVRISAETEEALIVRRAERKWMLRPVWWTFWLAVIYFFGGFLFCEFFLDGGPDVAWATIVRAADPASIWLALALAAWWVYRLQRWMLARVPDAFADATTVAPAAGVAAS